MLTRPFQGLLLRSNFRFFHDTNLPVLAPTNFKPFEHLPNPVRVQELAGLKSIAMEKAQSDYGNRLLLKKFSGDGKILYMIRGESPKEIVEQGGFVSRDYKGGIAVSFDSGNNLGSVCLSKLPQITAFFIDQAKANSNTNTAYFYAIAVKEGFAVPGPWFQMISPHALPLDSYWTASKVELDGNFLRLVDTVGHIEKSKTIIPGEHHDCYVDGVILMPEKISQKEFNIFPRPSQEAQKYVEEIEAHYGSSSRSYRR